MGLTPDTSDMYPGSQMSHASYNGGHQRHAHPDILDAHGAWWVSCTLELICMFDVHTGNAVSETATFQRSRPLARGSDCQDCPHAHSEHTYCNNNSLGRHHVFCILGVQQAGKDQQVSASDNKTTITVDISIISRSLACEYKVIRLI